MLGCMSMLGKFCQPALAAVVAVLVVGHEYAVAAP